MILLDCYGRRCDVLQKLALSSEGSKLFACMQNSFSGRGHVVGISRSKLIRQYLNISKVVLYLVIVPY